MTNKILIFSILFLSTNLISQTTQNLDSKYGFKHFKLKSNPNQYNGQLEKFDSWNKNPHISSYNYIKEDISQIGGVSIDRIELTFYKNELMGIMVFFGSITKEFSESEYSLLVYSLEKLYGKPFNIDSDLGDPDFKFYGGKVWRGNKVDLELMRIKQSVFPKIQGYISIIEKSMQQKMIEEDF